MSEEWRNIPNFASYQVSSLGRVRSLDRTVTRCDGHQARRKGRVLRSSPNQDGYQTVQLSIAGVRWTRLVHEIVAGVFLGERPAGCEVHHWNFKRSDNRLDNLVYRPGVQHLAEHFTGEDNPASKLTDDRVAEVKYLLQQGVSQWAIANRMGVNQSVISRIKNGQAWRHIPAPAADQLFLSFTLDTVNELAF